MGNEVKEQQTAQIISQILGIKPTDTQTLKLIERKISPDVLGLFDVQSMGNGWSYKTPSGATRWKNIDSKAENKYAWIGEKRDSLLYAFDIAEAVSMADDSIWLVTEFDVLAMRSANVWNVIGQLTAESSVPDELPSFLQSLGVLVCHIVPDRDTTGQRWAQLVTDRLIPAGIDVVIHDLPSAITPKHGEDVGKYWQGYNSPRRFIAALQDLPNRRLSPTQKPAKTTAAQIENPRDYEGMKSAIAAALHVIAYNDKGYSKPFPCIFHDDEKPSAALHKHKGYKCFVCGEMGWKQTAAKLGMEWMLDSAGDTSPAEIAPRVMLGDETLNAMIAAGFSVLAHSIQTAYLSGWEVGKPFTKTELMLLLDNEKRARKACLQMTGEGFDLRKQNKRIKAEKAENQLKPRFISVFSFTNKEALNLGINSKSQGKGRKSKVFRLPSPEDIAGIFGVSDRHYSITQRIDDLVLWRAEILACRIDRQAGEYTVKELGKEQKNSTSTTRSYLKRAKVQSKRNYDRKLITSADELPELPEIGGYLESDVEGLPKRSPTKIGYERLSQRFGGKIYLVKYLASTYWRNDTQRDKVQVLNEIEAMIQRPADPQDTQDTAETWVYDDMEVYIPDELRDKVANDLQDLIKAYRAEMGIDPSPAVIDSIKEWQFRFYDSDDFIDYEMVNEETMEEKTIFKNNLNNYIIPVESLFLEQSTELKYIKNYGTTNEFDHLARWHKRIAPLDDETAKILIDAASWKSIGDERLSRITWHIFKNKKEIGNLKAYLRKAIKTELEKIEIEEKIRQEYWRAKRIAKAIRNGTPSKQKRTQHRHHTTPAMPRKHARIHYF